MDYLPPSNLGKWQLVVASAAVFNSVQNYLTLNLTRRLYNNVPAQQVTALQARTFAVWTLLAAVVRSYAAYNIHDKTIYDITLVSYLLAFGHFGSEILIYKTARPGPVLSSVVVASVSMVWMIVQYPYYIKST